MITRNLSGGRRQGRGHPSTFFRDLRLAIRSLARRPGFTAVAVGTVALALAANTAMFSIVHGVLLRPLPFREPDRLVTLDARASTGFLVSLSMPNYRDSCSTAGPTS